MTALAYPDTLVGTDSHTTMINGLGVLGWGVGGIEAEAAMLGQPVSMLRPAGRRLQAHRQAPRGRRPPPTWCSPSRRCCASSGVVGKFVEFYGAGRGRAAAGRPRHHRQHGARIRRDLRHLPDRRSETLRLPAPHRPQRRARSPSSRPTPRSRGCSTPRTPGAGVSPTCSNSIWPTWSRRSPARSGRRTASRCRR